LTGGVNENGTGKKPVVVVDFSFQNTYNVTVKLSKP
jgi:hypothetical protein